MEPTYSSDPKSDAAVGAFVASMEPEKPAFFNLFVRVEFYDAFVSFDEEDFIDEHDTLEDAQNEVAAANDQCWLIMPVYV